MCQQFSKQFWIWWGYFKNRVGRLFSRLWRRYFAPFSLVVLFITTGLSFWAYSRGGTLSIGALLDLHTGTSMILSGIYLGVGAACLIAIFVILFFLSLFSRGRGIADKLFGLPEYTELEQLKNEITRELSGITRANTRMNTRLDNVEATVNDVSKKIAAIIKTSGGASHATALSTTKAKTKKEGKKKSGRT